MSFLLKMLSLSSKPKLGDNAKDLRRHVHQKKAVSCPVSDTSSDDEDGVVGIEFAPPRGRHASRRSLEAERLLHATHGHDNPLSGYSRLRVIHRGKQANVLLAFEIKSLRDVVLKAYPIPTDGPTSLSGRATVDEVLQEFSLLTRLASGGGDDASLPKTESTSWRDSDVDYHMPEGRASGLVSTDGRTSTAMPSDEYAAYLASSSSCSSLIRPAACTVPGLIRPICHFKADGHLYVVQEYCPGVTVIELMANQGGRLREITCCAQVVYPLLLTLSGLHAADVVHRQIQPDHVLCYEGRTVLIDFLRAANKRTQHMTHRVGALEYMAPEVLSKPLPEEIFCTVLELGTSEEELPAYDERCDLWSLGVMVFEALTGFQPFLGETAEDVVRAQLSGLSRQPGAQLPDLIVKQTHLSPAAQDFLCRTLQLDPAARASASQLLHHPWLDQLVSVHNVQIELRNAGGATRRSFSSGLINPS